MLKAHTQREVEGINVVETFYKEERNAGRSEVFLTESNSYFIGQFGVRFYGNHNLV